MQARGFMSVLVVAALSVVSAADAGPTNPSWLGVYVGSAKPEIVAVLRNTPADRAGLVEGDVVRRIGDRSIGSAAELISTIARLPAGSQIVVWIERRSFARSPAATGLEPIAVMVEAKPSPSEILRRQFLGTPADDFALEQDGGGLIRLSDLRGEVVAVDFFEPDDGACVATLHTLAELEARGAVVLLVTSDGKRAHAALRRAGVRPLPVLVDRRGNLRNAYNGHQGQLLVIVDRDGSIAHVHVGADKKELERAFELGTKLLSPLSALLVR